MTNQAQPLSALPVHDDGTPTPRAVLALLHGYGASADDLRPVAQAAPAGCRALLLRAPYATEWGGGRAWFRIGFTGNGITVDEAEARASVRALQTYLQQLRAASPGVPLFVAGFSQGAMMSLLAALTLPGLVDGVVCWSGLLPAPFSTEVVPATAAHPLPLWVGHGLQDDVLPIRYAREIRTTLERAGYRFSYNEYPARHEITPPMLRDAYTWLDAQMAAQGRAAR